MAARRASGGRAGPRASFACTICRSRKVKCDVQRTAGGYTTCSPCRTAAAECIVDRDEKGDRRRRAAQHREMDSLHARIHAMESAMGQIATLNSPQTSVASEGQSNGFVSSFPLTPTEGSLSVPHCQPSSGGHALSSTSHDLQNDSQAAMQSTPPVTDQMPDTERPAIANQEFCPSGYTYLAQGLKRADAFYGRTAQQYARSSRTVETDQWALPDDLDDDIAISTSSTQLRKLLLEESWRYYRLPASIVNRDLFDMHRQLGQRSHYYSDFLESALLACAARLSTSSAVRQCGSQFAQLAKASIAYELEDPSFATIQGFLLLSDYAFTIGNSRLGWTYSGIAIRLSMDLGLFEDPTDLVNELRISPLEGKLRQYLFLTAFVFDSLWSLYLGRPSTISASELSTSFTHARQALVNNPMLDAWVSLCAIISQVTEIMNKSQSLDSEDLDHLSQLDRELTRWFESLPPQMRGDKGSFSGLDSIGFALSTQSSGLRIILHRACDLYRRRNIQTFAASSDEQVSLLSYTPERSRDVIYKSAIRIARLVNYYIQIYGVEKLGPVMLDNIALAGTALTTHLATCHEGGVTPAIKSVRSLHDILSKAQKHYPVAAIMKATLSREMQEVSMTNILNHNEQSQFL